MLWDDWWLLPGSWKILQWTSKFTRQPYVSHGNLSDSIHEPRPAHCQSVFGLVTDSNWLRSLLVAVKPFIQTRLIIVYHDANVNWSNQSYRRHLAFNKDHLNAARRTCSRILPDTAILRKACRIYTLYTIALTPSLKRACIDIDRHPQ